MNILVLCTGNSVRSILAEAIFNRDGAGRVRAYSAGSNPAGRVHPAALSLLARRNMPTTRLRSKSWDEFAAPGAPTLDLVITMCAAVQTEACPDLPGPARKVHWGIDDPASAPRDQMDIAFQMAYHQLSVRINRMLALPLERIEPCALIRALTEIGRLR